MSGINFANYPNLAPYEILSDTGITSANTTTVNNGKYGTVSGSITGTFVATGSPSGLDNGNAAAAHSNVITLMNDVFNIGLPIVNLNDTNSGVTLTLVPNVQYNPTSLFTLTFNSNTVINFDAQGNNNAQFFIILYGNIVLNTVTMNLLNGACSANIFWLAYGGGITVTSVPIVYGNLISDGAITITGSPVINGRIYINGGGALSITGNTTTNANSTCASVTPTTTKVVCYAKGSKILTPNGNIPIEDLKAGDNVISRGQIKGVTCNVRDPAVKPILWISKFTLANLSNLSRPICIQKNALGENTPFEDLYVSPDHRILLGNLAVTAKELVNGKTIVQTFDQNTVTYYHLELDHHSVVIANGVLAETYVDRKTRQVFESSPRFVPPEPPITKRAAIPRWMARR
jgi:hypothetical protein